MTQLIKKIKEEVKNGNGIMQAELIKRCEGLGAASTVRRSLSKLAAEGVIVRKETDEKPRRVFWTWAEPEDQPDDIKEQSKDEAPKSAPEEIKDEKDENPINLTEIDLRADSAEEMVEKPVKKTNTRKKERKPVMWSVYYQTKEELRKSLSSFNNEKVENRKVNLERDFRLVNKFSATSKEEVFSYHQAEAWSPNGEQNLKIKKLGLAHTSMSVGDILVNEKTKEIFRCTPSGWITVEKDGTPEPKKKEKTNNKAKKKSGGKAKGGIKRTTKPGTQKVSRLEAAVMAIISGKKKMAETADKIYQERGGKSNEKEAAFTTKVVYQVVKHLKEKGVNLTEIDIDSLEL